MCLDGGVEAVDGGAQAEHFFGCVQMIERREEEASRGVGISDSAADEQSSERVKCTGLACYDPALDSESGDLVDRGGPSPGYARESDLQ